MNEAMKDLGYSDMQRLNMLIPSLTQNIEVRDNLRKDKELVKTL